ncbi:MAG: XrtA system polysaccharide chain length determinant [Rhodanobacteraceae bacterium]
MGEDAPLTELLPVLWREGRRRVLAMALIFAGIALTGLIVGALWPKNYTTSTSIVVQRSNIITPLMEGRAVATGAANRASIAREVIYSRKVMDDILKVGGWMDDKPSPVEQARIIDGIKGRTQVTSQQHDSLITITYTDSDAQRAYKVTRRFASLFIKESLDAKMRESRDAFQFIDSQVKAYHSKIAEAESRLKDYRETHVDARPGDASDTNSRIGSLRSGIETARMNLTELNSQQNSLQSQLAGESEVTAVQTRTGQISTQIAQLQGQLQTLLLTYTDNYPDVVRIRHQIDDLKRQLDQEKQRSRAAKVAGTPSSLDENVQFNPLYQDLRSKLADIRRQIASNQARLAASQRMLATELERSKRIDASADDLAALTRDYDVNKDVYQDLLKRRENARVSMNLDKDHRGLTISVQDPASLPLRPSGLRMLHFAIAGLGLGMAIPLGLLFCLVRFDPRARSARQLERIGIPVLASVPVYATASDRRREVWRVRIAVLISVAVLGAYFVVMLLRLQKIL